jgi:fibronectin type 3 domain-containing protein
LGNAATGSSYDIGFDDVSVSQSQSQATAPAAPTLTGTASTGAVSLSWTTPSNGGSPIIGYAVYRGTTPGGESLLTTVGVTNSYNDTTVSNGTTYYYQVAAINSVGTGALSNENTETPSATAPAAPTLTATAGNQTVSLSWTTPSNGGSPITGYAIYRGTSPGGESLLTTTGVTNSYNDTTVSNGTTYYYEVAAINAVGTGALSSEVGATPSATAPAAPTLSGTAGNGAVSLSWTTPSDGGSPITGYAIYRGTTPGGESLLTTIGVSNSYNDTTVSNGTTYYYEVAAINAVGTGALSSEVAETPLSPPSAPTGLTAKPASGKGVQLSWTASAGATSYHVYRSTTATGPFSLIASSTSQSYKDTATTRGRIYYYEVTAVNSAGESQPSSIASAKAT